MSRGINQLVTSLGTPEQLLNNASIKSANQRWLKWLGPSHTQFTPTYDCCSRNQDLSNWAMFSNHLLSTFSESQWTVAPVPWFYLLICLVFRCCNPAASGFGLLCVQRCFSSLMMGGYLIIWAFQSASTNFFLLWPLPPTRHFNPENWCSRDISSCSLKTLKMVVTA